MGEDSTLWRGGQIALTGVIAWFLGWPGVFQFLLIMQVLDIVSGVIAAGKRQEIESAIAWNGLRKKLFAWIIVMTIAMIENYLVSTFGAVEFAGLTPAEVAAAGFAVVEITSVLENAGRAGVPLPVFLRNGLAVLRKQFPMEENKPDGE